MSTEALVVQAALQLLLKAQEYLFLVMDSRAKGTPIDLDALAAKDDQIKALLDQELAKGN